MRQNGGEDVIFAAIVPAIMIAAIIAVLIASTEALAEVVAVLVQIKIITRVAERRVLIGIGILIAEPPSILSVCPSCAVAFMIAVMDGLSQQIRGILIDLVVPATPIIMITRRRVEVGVVFVVRIVAEPSLLLAQEF